MEVRKNGQKRRNLSFLTKFANLGCVFPLPSPNFFFCQFLGRKKKIRFFGFRSNFLGQITIPETGFFPRIASVSALFFCRKMKGKKATEKKIWWNPLKQKSEISGFSKSANPQNPSKNDDFGPILRILKNPHFSSFLRVRDFPQISSKPSIFVFLGLFSRFRTFWGFLDLIDFPPNFVKIDVFWGFGALFSKPSVWSFFVNFELFWSFFRNPRFGAFSSILTFFLDLDLFSRFGPFSVFS